MNNHWVGEPQHSACTHMLTQAHTYTLTCTHVCAHTHTALTCTRVHVHAHTHAHLHAFTCAHVHTVAHWLLFLPRSEGPTDVPLGSSQLMLRFLSQGRKSWKRKITPSSPLILLNGHSSGKFLLCPDSRKNVRLKPRTSFSRSGHKNLTLRTWCCWKPVNCFSE